MGEWIYAIDIIQATKKRARQKRLPQHHTEGVVGEVKVQAAFLKTPVLSSTDVISPDSSSISPPVGWKMSPRGA